MDIIVMYMSLLLISFFLLLFIQVKIVLYICYLIKHIKICFVKGEKTIKGV
jgi:hypothetical protein